MKQKITLLTVLALWCHSAFGACGDYYYGQVSTYDVFDQTILDVGGFRPFLLDLSNTYYGDEEAGEQDAGNLKVWQQLLTKSSIDVIKILVYTDNDHIRQKVLSEYPTSVSTEVSQYLQYVHKANTPINTNTVNTWSYADYKESQPYDTDALIDIAYERYNTVSNLQVKRRYAYQIVRLYFYGKRYDDGIAFYDRMPSDEKGNDELSYYLLDFYAGCHFRLKNTSIAAANYLRVWANSYDRKIGAYRSYHFAQQKDVDISQHLKTSTEQLYPTLIANVSGFASEQDAIRQIGNQSVDPTLYNVLLLRAVKSLENAASESTRYGLKEEGPSFPIVSDELFKRGSALKSLVHQSGKHLDSEQQSLIFSYIDYLLGDIASANTKLSNTTSAKYMDSKKVLKVLYEVSGWDSITPDREQTMMQWLDTSQSDDDPIFKLTDIVKERVGHLYLKDGQLAKSFLVHNQWNAVNEIFSLPLLDDLIDLANSNDKIGTQLLALRQNGITSSPNEYFTYHKGMYYLVNQDYDQERELLENNNLGNSIGSKGRRSIHARVFSNWINPSYSSDDPKAMTDSVFLSKPLALSDTTLSRVELVNAIQSLHHLSQNGKEWEQKLSHYLLGNYYYNISNQGRYRGNLLGIGNYRTYHQRDRFNTLVRSADYIEENKLYNMEYINANDFIYSGEMSQVRKHYRAALSLSDDEELNARITYLLALCDQKDLYYSQEYIHGDKWGDKVYDGTYDDVAAKYLKSLPVLKEKFGNTDFYQQALKSCGFLRHYDAM